MPHAPAPSTRLALGVVVCLACFGATAPLSAAEPAAPAAVSFQREVLPILRARCQGCHQPARAEGGVVLTTRDGLLAESESGLAPIVPGDADSSELLAQIIPDDAGRALMPKDGDPLSAAEIDVIRRWIAGGATFDAAAERPRYDAEHPPIYSKPATIAALDVSPDGSLIALGGVNETLLLDASAALRGERQVVRRLVGLSARIESLRFSPDGARLAVAGGNPGEQGELQVWEVASGKLLLSRSSTADTISGTAWSPDGKSIAFGGADTTLYVVGSETGELQLEQGAHSDWVMDAVFSTDGKYVVSGSRDQSLKLVEAATGRFVDNVTNVSPGVPSGPVFALARHPGRDLVAAGGGEGLLRTYMMHRVVDRRIGDDSNLVRAYPSMPGRIFAVAFSPDGTRVAAASSDGAAGHVRVFAVPDAFLPPEDVKLIQAKVATERTPEEKTRLDAYHHESAELTATAAGEMKPVYAIAFHPDGKTLLSGGADGVLHVHAASDGAAMAQVDVFEVTPPASQLADAAASAPVEFLTDVMPVLGKLGCNAGTCHGARTGQNGFSLSLRGYNPLGDHRALTDDHAARRINLADPASSLMLLKATGAIPHGGNAVVETGSRRYEILRRWIAEGARFNPEAPRVVSITVAPVNPVVDALGGSLAMKVVARYTDGSERDVSEDAFIESGDTECATADAAGTITALRRGEAPILARYEGAYAATTLTVMGDRTGFEPTAPPVYNRIDELVDVKLARMKIAASGLCTDEEFLRRVHLDLTGLPPTAANVRSFLADQRDSRTKRAAKVDELIGSDDYVEHWTNRWADLLLVNGRFLGAEGAAGYRQWIRTAIAENRPYDRFVRELFASTGSNRTSPGGSFFKALRTPDAIAETTTQVFLGVRFNCNKCHDHPFERWTQDNYYGWAAFFADVRLQKDPESGDRTVAGSAVEAARPLYEIVDDGAGGEMIHLRTGKTAPPRFPYAAGGAIGAADKSAKPLRLQAAEWLTARDNPYFATGYVNRVWAHLTGVGLIEPIDDIRAGNPATNPELLAWLTDEFIASGFDVRSLLRTICNSRTYQLSHHTNPWNEDDRRNYSHALARRLPAEALYDAVHRVVGSTTQLPGVPPGTRAAALPDSMIELESGLLSKLGRPARESGCECERSSELQLGPVMALLNGPTFAQAIDDPQSELAKLEAATADDGLLADEVFLRVLGRAPTPAERAAAVEMIASPPAEGAEIAATLAERTQELSASFDSWRQANRPVRWHALAPLEMSSGMGATLQVQDDGSVLSTGAAGAGAYMVRAEAPLATIRGVRIEAIADDRLPTRGPGRADNGNFVLSQLRVFVAAADKPDARRKLKIAEAQADLSQPGYDVSGAIDAKPETGWAVANGLGQSHAAVFRFARPLTPEENTRLVFELDHQYADGKHLLGRFRISVTDEEPPLMRPDVPPEWRALLAARQLGATERDQLMQYYLSLDVRYRELQQAHKLLANPRLNAVQDLAWALINSPAFLFNH